MTQKAQEFWDKQAKRYDGSEKQFAAVYKTIIAKTVKYLSRGDQVLDFGCATGTKTLELAGKVKHIHGLDFSSGMISEALRKKDEFNIPNVSFSRGTIFSSELKESSFDIIIAFAVLQLLEDKEKVTGRIYELLEPGGLFISTTACMKGHMTFKNKLQVAVYRFMKRVGLFPLHINLFTSADVEKLLVDHHFQIVESEKFFSGLTAVFIVARKMQN